MNDYLPEMNYLTKEKPDDRYVCAVGVQSKTEADPDEAPVPRKSGISGAEVLAIPGIAAESGEVRLKITTLTLVPKVPSVPKVFKIKKIQLKSYIMKMKRKTMHCILSLCLLSAASVNAQVTIGGLALSSIAIEDLGKIPANVLTGISSAQGVNEELRGTMVYNTGTPGVPVGIYVWNGYCWTPDGNCTLIVTTPSSTFTVYYSSTDTDLAIIADGCPPLTYTWYKNAVASTTGGNKINEANAMTYRTPADLANGIYYYYCTVESPLSYVVTTSDLFTLTVLPNLASMPDGMGTLSGRTFFDIAESNSGADCGELSARTANKADFATLGPVSYTFTATTADVSNVRYVIQDVEGCVVSTPLSGTLESGALSNGSSVTLNVNYKTTLNSESSTPQIYGRTHAQAAVVTVNIIYYNGSADVKVPLKVSIQDCLTCGAYTAPGVFKVFMCHNLGADRNADPFTPVAAIHGAKYKWGLKDATLTQDEDQTTSGSISNWASKGGTPPDWDMTNANPCPAGYRVPTQLEWEGVVNNNPIMKVGTWTNNATNYSSGMKVGNSLFLPAAGYRDYDVGTLARGSNGCYWSSTYTDIYAYSLDFGSNGQSINHNHRSGGFSVRCVVE